MTPEQIELNRQYTYIFKNMHHRDALNFIRAKPANERDKYRRIINFIKRAILYSLNLSTPTTHISYLYLQINIARQSKTLYY